MIFHRMRRYIPRQVLVQDPVPAWLSARLYNLAHQRVHYESSFGGAHNGFLNCYFPVSHGYMVKPIPRLRTPVDPTVAFSGRNSVDSYGAEVQTSPRDDIPDFLVCKATASLHADIPFLIWELKRDSRAASSTSTQMARYEEWLFYHQRREVNSTGLGSTTWVAVVEKGDVTMLTYDVDIHTQTSIWAMYEVLDPTLHHVLIGMRDQYL